MTGQDEALPPLSVETLPLYLPLWKDGALPSGQMAEVEELTRGNEEAKAILALLERADDRLQGAFSDTLEAPVPIAMARRAADAGAALGRHAPANRRSAPGIGRAIAFAAAAAVVAGVLGVFAGYSTGEIAGRDQAQRLAEADTREKFGWVAQIAGYHRLYSAEDRHLVEVAADETDHIQSWIGQRTGRAFIVPDLTAAGLQFRGARLLAVDGKPTAQLMYAPEDGGDPVGLCFLATGAEDAGFAAASRDGFNLVTWRRGGYSFIAIGTLAPDRMDAVARSAAVTL